MFRTRQAPSPTGFLHIGTARTVLFTKLFAMVNEGKWFLRLEDTDRNRLQADAVKVLLGALDGIGLSADEGITLKNEENQTPDSFYGIYQKGEFGPYIQSLRLEIYHQHAQKLLDLKLAYWSYLTPEEKQELQEIKQITKRPINYFKVCSTKYEPKDMYQSVESALKDDRKPVMMYKLQRDNKIVCKDELLGPTEFDLNLEEDFGILKSDGYPTYHLAHLIDDHLMNTTLVVRSQEWLPSFPKHQTMFMDYWGTAPQFAHVPFILGEAGNKKMSKRDGNVNMQDYLDKGYLPEAIINYLAFLGWNPGTEKEMYN
jgi:nondiscriminating glutamyl-tRNA synthetase